MKVARISLFALILTVASAAAHADDVRYSDGPAGYPEVTTNLASEFGGNPYTENTLNAYQVQGSGSVDLKFRFKYDTGSYSFNFGFYKITSALNAIDLSTDAGRTAYAQMALSSATLVFDDSTQDPGATATITATGGDLLGFFLIPNGSLADYQANPGNYPIDNTGSPAPFFSVTAANPGGYDQLLSFDGLSAVTGEQTSMFAWEDLTRTQVEPPQFNDLVFTVEGVKSAPTSSVPGPAALMVFGVGALGRLRRKRA